MPPSDLPFSWKAFGLSLWLAALGGFLVTIGVEALRKKLFLRSATT